MVAETRLPVRAAAGRGRRDESRDHDRRNAGWGGRGGVSRPAHVVGMAGVGGEPVAGGDGGVAAGVPLGGSEPVLRGWRVPLWSAPTCRRCAGDDRERTAKR